MKHATTYEVRLSHVPSGAYAQQFLCGPSNGNGDPDQAYCFFDSRADAEQVVGEFYSAKSTRPGDFPSEMEVSIVEVDKPALATATITGEDGQALALELRRDQDGAYRWYQEDGADTEVSGRDVRDAIEQGRAAWRTWSFQLDV